MVNLKHLTIFLIELSGAAFVACTSKNQIFCLCELCGLLKYSEDLYWNICTAKEADHSRGDRIFLSARKECAHNAFLICEGKNILARSRS